jgi:hypothetical protein
MKKITLIALIAGSIFTTNQLSAQGGLKKFKDKLENSLTPKNSYYVYFENIVEQKKSDVLGVTKAFTVVDTSNIITCKYLTEDVANSSYKMPYKKHNLVSKKETIFIEENSASFHNGAIKINDSTFMFIQMQGVECELKNLRGVYIVSKDKEFVNDLVKNYDKGASYKVLEAKMTDYMGAWNKLFADEKAKEDKKRADYDAAFELPKPSNFMPVSQSVLKQAAEDKFNQSGKNKIIYAYFASPSYAKLKNQTEWQIVKEMKTVNGTYDNFITKRTLDVVLVMQYQESNDMEKKQYSIRHVILVEDAAFGVYDGSKFSGKYYFQGYGNNLNSTCPEPNAMKYINVLK